MKYIECPNHYERNEQKGNVHNGNKCEDNQYSLFIAGGITGCSDWQKQFVKNLKNEKIVLYNPRRKNFRENDPSITEEQILWEYKYLKVADATSFWFTKETLCPITLFELGKQLAITDSYKPVFLGIDPNYGRKIDLEIQVKLIRPEIKIVYDLNSLSNQIKKWIRTN